MLMLSMQTRVQYVMWSGMKLCVGLDWPHLILSNVTTKGVLLCAVIDLLNGFRGDVQASGAGKACTQHCRHVIVVLKIRDGENSVVCQILIGLCLTSSNIPALLQSNMTADSAQLRSVCKACKACCDCQVTPADIQVHAGPAIAT